MKLQVGKTYSFVVQGDENFYIASGEIVKIGKKYIYYKSNNMILKEEISKIIEIFPPNSEREKEWELYFLHLNQWKLKFEEAKKEIQLEESIAMRKRISEKIKNWLINNPQPQPPLKKISINSRR